MKNKNVNSRGIWFRLLEPLPYWQGLEISRAKS